MNYDDVAGKFTFPGTASQISVRLRQMSVLVLRLDLADRDGSRCPLEQVFLFRDRWVEMKMGTDMQIDFQPA
jgi:hypothetical protein